MAIIGVNQVAPRQPKRETTGGKLQKPLQGLGALAGGVAGGLAGGPMGAISGAQSGAGLGSFIGERVDPTRTREVTPQQTQQQGSSNIAQRYKLSDDGRAVLSGLEAIKQAPDLAEYTEPLAMALLQDIARNNQRGGQV